MYPLTCPDGNEHDFKGDSNSPDLFTFKCSVCGVKYDTFQDEEEKVESLKNMIKEVVNSTNGISSELFVDTFMKVMHETHRTIQQRFFKSLAEAIIKMQEMPKDLRNAFTVEWCKEVSKIPQNFPLI